MNVTYAALDLTSGNTSGSKVKSIIAVYRLRMKSIVSSGTSGDIVLQTGNYIMGWNLLTQVIGVQYNQGEGVGRFVSSGNLRKLSCHIEVEMLVYTRRQSQVGAWV
jgi:hypothetical protein